MAAFTALLGDTLKGPSGNVSTVDALGGKEGVFLYFSAHWCPPCRGFTPVLANFHKTFADKKGFATVFVSSDNSEGEFNEYFGEMPWLALPYADRERKGILSKKYKVQGIPSLVLLAADGSVITKDGRSKVMEHKDDCAGFPWKPRSLAEVLGDSFVKQDGSTVGKDAIAGKTLGLYFSAHWCPPCRGFTPKLKEFYNEYKAGNSQFEIIFVSSDKDNEGMMDYFKNDHGNYLALPFAKRDEKNELSNMFGVQGIPTFVVVGPDGKTLTANGRGKVGAGAKAVLEEGWEPSPVGDMAEGPEAAGTDINECPSIVVICDKCSAAVQDSVKAAMLPMAKKYISEAAGEDPAYIFIVAKGGGPMEQLKDLTKKEAGSKLEGDGPVMMLFDIPDNGAFYISSATEITSSSIEAFIKSKEDGKEKRMQLGR